VIRTRGDCVHTLSFDTGIPDPDLSHQETHLVQKFHSLTNPVIGLEKALRLREEIDRLDFSPNLNGLTALWPGGDH